MANIELALPAIAKNIKGDWENVQSVHLKTNQSAALPIWSCNLEDRWTAPAVEQVGAEIDSSEVDGTDGSADSDEDEDDEEMEAPAPQPKSKEKGKKRALEVENNDGSKKKARKAITSVSTPVPVSAPAKPISKKLANADVDGVHATKKAPKSYAGEASSSKSSGKVVIGATSREAVPKKAKRSAAHVDDESSSTLVKPKSSRALAADFFEDAAPRGSFSAPKASGIHEKAKKQKTNATPVAATAPAPVPSANTAQAIKTDKKSERSAKPVTTSAPVLEEKPVKKRSADAGSEKKKAKIVKGGSKVAKAAKNEVLGLGKGKKV
jgi:ribosome biogenesis protein UTP30